MEKQIIPVIDLELLQKKANEYAQKGAEKVLEDFYTGYNSPYKKAIEENLKNKDLASRLEIPDIIGILNTSFSNKIDEIANTAIAKSFIPQVQKFLTREEPEINLSDVLKKFIDCFSTNSPDEFIFSMTKSDYGWYNVELISEDEKYSLTLHTCHKSENTDKIKYQFRSLPWSYGNEDYKRTMKLKIDENIFLEMPFTSDVLKDDFMSYIARLVISKSQITIDCDDFDEEWFPRNECHC